MSDIETTALMLPDEKTISQQIQAVNRFQQIVHKNLIAGSDFGTIPGTQKPTLLKPGAEKIAKLLGLSDQYEILDRQEDWLTGFFRYLIKCRLIHIVTGVTLSEGLGECNSMESKYRFRWVFQSELPAHLQGEDGKPERDKLPNKMANTRNGKVKMYKVDNEDIYSQVNTILKMAKKRALVDASLSAGRLSDVFTQDIEDLPEFIREEPQPAVKPQTSSVPPRQNDPLLADPPQKPKTKVQKQPESEPETEAKKEAGPEVKQASKQEPASETEDGEQSEKLGFIDSQWFAESLGKLQQRKLKAWTDENLLGYMKTYYKVEGQTIEEVVAKLGKNESAHFVNRIQETLQLL